MLIRVRRGADPLAGQSGTHNPRCWCGLRSNLHPWPV